MHHDGCEEKGTRGAGEAYRGLKGDRTPASENEKSANFWSAGFDHIETALPTHSSVHRGRSRALGRALARWPEQVVQLLRRRHAFAASKLARLCFAEASSTSYLCHGCRGIL